MTIPLEDQGVARKVAESALLYLQGEAVNIVSEFGLSVQGEEASAVNSLRTIVHVVQIAIPVVSKCGIGSVLACQSE